MKKAFLVIILLLVSFVIYSETWVSTGFEYSYLIENDIYYKELTYKTNSFGMGINYAHYFQNKDIGFFVHGSLLIPFFETSEFYGYSQEINLNEFDLRLHLGLLAGPIFKIKVNDNSDIHFGLGLNIYEKIFIDRENRSHDDDGGYDTSESEIYYTTLGIGGEIGYRKIIKGNLHFDVGLIMLYGFYMHVRDTYNSFSQECDTTEKNANKNYKMLSYNPYLLISINL